MESIRINGDSVEITITKQAILDSILVKRTGLDPNRSEELVTCSIEYPFSGLFIRSLVLVQYIREFLVNHGIKARISIQIQNLSKKEIVAKLDEIHSELRLLIGELSDIELIGADEGSAMDVVESLKSRENAEIKGENKEIRVKVDGIASFVALTNENGTTSTWARQFHQLEKTVATKVWIVAPNDQREKINALIAVFPEKKIVPIHVGSLVGVDSFHSGLQQIVALLGESDRNSKEETKKLAKTIFNLHILARKSILDVEFSPENDMAVYIQYTHARLCGIQRENEQVSVPLEFNKESDNKDFYELASELNRCMEIGESCVDSPSTFVTCLYGLCRKVSSLSYSLRVKGIPNGNIAGNRLLLFSLCKEFISRGLSMCGLEPLEYM